MPYLYGASFVLDDPKCTVSKRESKVNLAVASVHDLGLKGKPTTQEVYDQAKKFGLDLCPPEVGPQLRLQYPDQPIWEWLFIAMEPIKVPEGYPCIFHVGRCDDGDYHLYAFSGEPNDRWGSGAQFVFVRR